MAFLLFSGVLCLGCVRLAGGDPSTLVVSAWLENPVKIDGRMTSTFEWPEAKPVDLAIGLSGGTAPPFFKMRVWAKNDDASLYLLGMIEYPYEQRDEWDWLTIAYYWPEYNETVGRWPHSDSGGVCLGGEAGDGYGWDEKRWYDDVTEASPPGQNNVEGAASHDGIYYWFEIKKALNSGDGCDWNFEQGEIYPQDRGSLMINLWDQSEWRYYVCALSLKIAGPPQKPTQTGETSTQTEGTSTQAPTLVVSAWLENPVKIDGRMTSTFEWPEAKPIDLTIGLSFGTIPPFYKIRIWAKNDDAFLYLLGMIEYPYEQRDEADWLQMSYFWPEPGGPYSDSGGVCLGATWDGYGWDGRHWYDDVTEASPPGQNNVEGAASHDGIYYWFEMKKALNSGDGYDWDLKPGEIYPQYKGGLLIELWDGSEGRAYNSRLSLKIAGPPQKPTQTGETSTQTEGMSTQTEEGAASGVSFDWTSMYYILATLIPISGGVAGLVGWVLNTRKQRRKKSVMFREYLSEIDSIYTNFKMNAHQCEAELLKIKEQVMQEFKDELIDPEKYTILDKRLEDYLKEIRKEIAGKKDGSQSTE